MEERMESLKENSIYVAFDGDGIGRQVGRAVLDDDDDALHNVSKRIDTMQALITRWIKDNGGTKISGGGDECTMRIPHGAESLLEALRKDIEYAFGFTVSAGIGSCLSEAGKALLIAKLKGKNRIERFSREMEEEIKRIKKRAKKGAFKSMEEHKLADAYLKKGEATPQPMNSPEANLFEENCPYCKQTDGNDSDHCKYCHNEEVEGEEACPYCQNDPSMGAETPEIGDEDCQYCKEKDATAQDSCPYCKQAPTSLVSPDSNNEFAEAGSEAEKNQYEKMGMNPPIIGKPDPSKEPPIGQNAPMDTVPSKPNGDPIIPEEGEPSGKTDPRLDGGLDSEKTPIIDSEDTHSKEALIAIADQIKDEGTAPESMVDSVDDADLPGGSAMEGNISHPAGYEQNTPQDMGMGGPNPPSEGESGLEEPDLSDVLEEGLNHHAESIKKEKVIQVVSQALVQFQAAKQSLEQTKMQNPQLYQASIAMLKAMIEMATLLGLGNSDVTDNSGLQPQSEQTDSNLGQEQASLAPPQEEQNDEWHDPFPTHPDHGGEQKPGHAPPSKSKQEGANSPQR